MNKFEDPTDFDEKKTIGKVEIGYSNLMEVSQGGPVTGNVSIDGEKIPGRYGGPILLENDHMFIPVQVKRFIGTGFKLARIDLNTLKIEHLGEIKFFIYLDKVEDNKVCYFEDMEKSIRSYYEL
jgi:hypothetical protein